MKVFCQLMHIANMMLAVYHIIMYGFIVDGFEPKTNHMLLAIIALLLAHLMERIVERMD